MDDEISKKLLGSNSLLERLNGEHQAYERLRKGIAHIPDFAFPSISSPEFRMPEIHFPSHEERNAYQSASVLMQSIADEALQWKRRLPDTYRTAILAIMYGGTQIDVQTLSQVSFHGIRIEGTLGGAPCSLLAHQSTVQLLCYAEELKSQEQHNPIGFVWGNNRVEV